MIYPVILAGGAGTRLWPMSRSQFPKQLLKIAGDKSLLQQTAGRLAQNERFAAPGLIANDEHRFVVAEQMRECGVVPHAILLEPVGRNTAPAACLAALTLVRTDPDALMLIMPSDHVIARPEAFRAAVHIASAVAADGKLVTFGIRPERVETGYGYIRGGTELSDDGAVVAVAEFVEKPDMERATRFVEAGNYCWNSGIFLFPAQRYLDELERLHPQTVAHCRAASSAARSDIDFTRIDKDAFARCDSVSIDYAVMEHTSHAAMVPVSMGWNDVGSWDALWDLGGKDDHENVIVGNVVAEDTQNCYLRSEAKLVAAIGVHDLVVVATDDAVMIAPRHRTQDVKLLVARLAREKHAEVDALPTVHRPWGTYKPLHNGHRVQVKHITVRPGGKLSLQKHHHRAEHWVVVQGTAKVVRGNEELMLTEDQSTYIPLGFVHRLENPGKIPLHLIEVQSGAYLGEDDIVRIEDSYDRH